MGNRLLEDNGFYGLRQGEIAYVVIKDGDQFEQLMQPDLDDLERMCDTYGFDRRRTMNLIINRDKDVHGFMFETERYRAYLEETST